MGLPPNSTPRVLARTTTTTARVRVDIATGRMATDGAIPDDRALQSMRYGSPALPPHVGGLSPEQCGVLAALRDGARMWRPTLTRVVTRMMIPMPPPRRLPTTTMTPAAHCAQTCTVLIMTGELSSPSSSPLLTTPTSVPLLDATMPSMIRGSYGIRVPR